MMDEAPSAPAKLDVSSIETRATVPFFPWDGRMPSAIGGYRVLRRIGGGGMGEVYVAFDERLRRRVALKAIRVWNRLLPLARELFLREARVLSRLDHPHICQIHDYLESDAGDFLVLELIDGEDLDRAIPRLTVREKIAIAAQLADVLVTAHAAGIIHRDLKPSNVMITDAGAIKVLDFGLARAARPNSAATTVGAAGASPPVPDTPSADAPTRSLLLTGDDRIIMGTPSYMSPEQALGETATTASDMYSLGLLLQQLFTGQPPYEDGLTRDELIERAAAGAARPVNGVRHDVARLIDDLKALEPTARPTAADVAARLRRIRGKPRRRLTRVGIVAALVVAILAAVMYTIDINRAEANAMAAWNEADTLITFIIKDLGPHFDHVGRLDLMEKSADRVQGYIRNMPRSMLGDDDLDRSVQALQFAGRVRTKQGELREAADAFRESIAIATDIVDRNPENAEFLARLGASRFYIGQYWYDIKEYERALEQLNVYLEIADQLVALDPDDPRWRLEQAYAHNSLSSVYIKMGNVAAATTAIDASIAIKEELVADGPDDDALSNSLATGYSWLGSIRLAAEDAVGAHEAFLQELEIRERLVAAHPKSKSHQSLLATSHSLLAELLIMREQHTDALAHCRSAVRILTELTEHDPENTGWRRDLAVAHRIAAEAQRHLGEYDEAFDDCLVALTILDSLMRKSMRSPDWPVQLALLRHEMTAIRLAQERWRDVLDEADAAIAVLTPLLANDESMVRVRLAGIHLARGDALDKLARPDEATAAWLEGLDAIEPAVQTSGGADAHRLKVTLLRRLGRTDEADQLIRERKLDAPPDDE